MGLIWMLSNFAWNTCSQTLRVNTTFGMYVRTADRLVWHAESMNLLHEYGLQET